MQDSISRVSLLFRDTDLEADFTRKTDRNRMLFIRYIYSFLIVALLGILVLNLYSMQDDYITLRIAIHLAAVTLLIGCSRCFPRTTGYLGYIHITVYFAVHSIIPEVTYTTTMRTFTTGIGLQLLSAALIDNSWIVSSLLYAALTIMYWVQHRAFLETTCFDVGRAGVDSFLLVFVIGYATSYYKRMMFLQTKLLEDSSE